MYLLLETRIGELLNHGVSNLTWNTLDSRMRHGHHGVEVAGVSYHVSDDFLEADFTVDSTDSSNKKYSVILRFYKVGKYFTSDPSKSKYSVLEQMLRNIVHKCDVRFYSDDPSFLWQGVWEGLSNNDMSIFKFTGTKGDGVWDDRHMETGGLTNREVHLTKHLTQIVSQINEFVPKMAQRLEVLY